MPVFQVTSRSVQETAPPRKKPRRLRPEWFAALRFALAVSGGFFALLTFFTKGPYDINFLLLPVLVYLAAMQFQRYNLKLPGFIPNIFRSSSPTYLLFTACFAFVYYGAITGFELLIHPGNVSHILIITTALTATIIFDPVRVFVQRRIERRYNLRDRETVKAIEAFTGTLREEIDLDQLRERFLTVIQRTLQPYSVSLWVQTSRQRQAPAGATDEIVIADDDPLLAYLPRHPGALEVDRLQLDSPVLQELKLRAAELLVPLVSQGELIGLLVLGPHLKGEAYTNEERNILVTLAPQVAPALRVAQLVQERQTQVRERERTSKSYVLQRRFSGPSCPKRCPRSPAGGSSPTTGPHARSGATSMIFSRWKMAGGAL